MALSTYYHYTVAYTQLRFIYTDKNALLVGLFWLYFYKQLALNNCCLWRILNS